MSFPGHGVNFPVTQLLTSFNFGKALLNTHTVRELSPSIVAYVALSTFLLAAEMRVKITIVLLILIDMLVNPFMTDINSFSVFLPPRNLFWAPIHSDQLINPVPSFGFDTISRLISSAESFTACLFGSVPTFTSIATQSPADRGSMDTNLFGDISLAKSHFQHEINLVSMFASKQFTGIHRCPFDIFEGFWQALSYLSLLITSKIFVASYK